MHLPDSSERTGQRTLRQVILFPIIVGSLLLAAFGLSARIVNGQLQVQGFGRWPPNEQDPAAGVYLPTDRTLSRAVARARQRLADHEYHEALAFLHGVLGRDEDWFLDRTAGAKEQFGVKATARQLIGELPSEGYEAYELLHGAAARRQLEGALQSGDREGISKVVRQFFHTAAGYEAALVLAQIEADQGHRLAAAQLYQELIETPRAAAMFEPQLSVLAALNHLAAGQRELAREKLRTVFDRHTSTEISILGKSASAPAADADPLVWLSQFVGEPSDATREQLEWLTVRGDPSRNAQKPGGRPLLRPRWQARVVNDPEIEAYLAGRNEDFRQRGVAVVPSARPIAVGDVIVMRTPENVVAVDWKSGKRIWETRDDSELQSSEAPNAVGADLEREQQGRGSPLEERVWDDALEMSLCSDGQRVFVLRGVSLTEDEQVMGWAIAPGFGRMGAEVAATTNQLAAYDIATQGKLLWELDGTRSAAPLDGAFFLGAPLAIDNTLYVMAEIRSAIYLFAIDPATGAVQWQQQLVGLEQSVNLDPVRRRAGATPSYAGGILVCPTGTSAVIAIDVVKREFAWVYRYAREPQSAAEFRNIWQNAAPSPVLRVNDRWLDSTAVIGEGHVFVAPPESAELHCIDLQSGKLAWKHRQGDGLFVGAVDQGHVLIVGAEGVQALRVADGAAAWPRDVVPFPSGALPSGQGYLSEGKYFLPLTSGEIAEIDIASGQLTAYAAAKTDTFLGNLICYRGGVLSQSPLVLDKFEQLEVLRQRAESTLAVNPDDPTSLRDLAELKHTEGQTFEAVTLLKRALELAPTDAITKEMLAEELLEALANDYAAFRNDVPLLARLIRDRHQQIELLRIEASGLDKLNDRLGAFGAYLRLADFTAEGQANLRIGADYTVRSDRWICGRLGKLWNAATEEERAAIEKQLAARRPPSANPRTAAELRHYLAHMDELPGADDVRRALAALLVDRGRVQEAEFEILVLSTSSHQESREIAAQLMRRLDTLRSQNNTEVAARPWPAGQVDAELIMPAARSAESRTARAQVEQQAGFRPLRIEQEISPGPAPMHWFVAMDCSELVGRNSLGEDVFQLAIDQNSWARQYRDSNMLYAGRLGRLMFVTLGGQVMAIDSAGGSSGAAGDVLWQTDPMGRYSSEASYGRRSSGEVSAKANRRPVYHSWSDRKRIIGAVGAAVCSLGPVTPRGIVYQEHDELKCVDPLSGELLWARGDIPAGCELFGDSEFIFAADVSGRVAHVIQMVDGDLVGKRELPRHDWLLTAGRNVAEVGFDMNRQSRLLSLRIVNILSQEALFEGEFPLNSRVTVVEPSSIAVFEPTGKFHLIDAQNGQTVIDQQLEPFPNVQSIHTMLSRDKLFLLIGGQPNQQYKPLVQQPDFPIVDGLVYAFSRTTGETLWPAPAVVRNRGIILSLPQDVPLLLFADRKTSREAAAAGSAQLRILCLDQNTGQTVYRNDSLADSTITRFRIRGERDTGDTVAIEMGAAKIQLTMTDRPRPPQPPANDDLEARREIAERGLRGVGRRITGALQGALQEPADSNQGDRRQNQQIEQGKIQVGENAQETDDD